MTLTPEQKAELKAIREDNAYRAAKLQRRKLDEAELKAWAGRNMPAPVVDEIEANYTWKMMQTITEYRWRLLSRRLAWFIAAHTTWIAGVYLILIVLGIRAGHEGNWDYLPYPVIAILTSWIILVLTLKANRNV